MLTALAALVAAMGAPDYALQPGHERTFAGVMAARQGELPEGWGTARISVPTDRVEALYAPVGAAVEGCEAAPLCVRLLHPTRAGDGDVVVGEFAIHVVRGTVAGAQARGVVETDALVAGLRARLGAAGALSPWKALTPRLPPRSEPDANAATLRADEDAWRGLLSSDPDLLERLVRVEVEPERVVFHLRADEGPDATVQLTDRAPRQDDPSEVTRSFFVRRTGPLSKPADLARRVHAAVMTADDGRLRLGAQDPLATGERPWLHDLLIAASALCLIILGLGLPLLLWRAGRALGNDRWVWGLLALGVALRTALPWRLVEMGIGFQLTRMADTLALPRYGAGTTTLHHGLFQVFGTDHTVMLWTHKILGCAALPLAAAVGAALLRTVSRTPVVATRLWVAALALTPMLVRSDLTESNLVPVLLALWAALWAWTATTGAVRVALTAAGLAFAGLSRPEMAVVAPLLWLALTTPWRTLRPAVAVLLLTALPLAFQLAFVDQVISFESSSASLHLTKGLSPERLLAVLSRNALLDPRVVPLALVPLALASLIAPLRRGPLMLWLLGGLGWLYVYSVDLSGASIPRLHIVGVLPWSLAAAAGAAWLIDRRRTLGALALAAWALSAAATVPCLWAPTNEDTEARLFDRLAASLQQETGERPAGDDSSPLYTLALLSPADAPDDPAHFTHRHAPTYRFDAGRVVPLSRLADATREAGVSAARPVFYFQGVGCYARIGRSDGGPNDRGLLDACAAVHRHFALEPVWTEHVPNRGNPVHQELGYYSDEPEFEVGLWRVRQR